MFGGGGGGLNPRKMKQMMKQMGIEMDDIDAEEVIIRTPDEELYFDDADVQLMEAQGQKTYQVVGEPETRERGDGGGDAESADAADAGGSDAVEESQTGGGDFGIPDEDVELVAMRADVGEDEAREALEAEDGDLAAAVDRLE